jgi:hypothetical protein
LALVKVLVATATPCSLLRIRHFEPESERDEDRKKEV